MNRNKWMLAISMVVIVLAAVLVFARRPAPEPAVRGGQVVIVTTLFPLYDMARHIGGGHAQVTLLLPPGVEAHAFEPKPSDIRRIHDADIFCFTGGFMEPWAEDIVKGANQPALLVVDASRGTTLLPGHADEDGDAHATDPHIWMDFDNAAVMAANIERALIQCDPAHAEDFRRNAAAYRAALKNLDQSFRTSLAGCPGKEIVYGGHYALGYLAHRYGIGYVAAQGLAPDAEPTAKDLARLVEQIRRDRITTVFYEELTSPKIAETLARETHAGLLMLSSAHNLSRAQLEQGTTFFDILNQDLANLKRGLGCP